MYESIEQHAEAMQVLMEAMNFFIFKGEKFFEGTQATDAFIRLYEGRGKLSSGERTAVEAAADLWRWDTGFKLMDLRRLDARRANLVWSLFSALFLDGPGATKQWIVEHKRA